MNILPDLVNEDVVGLGGKAGVVEVVATAVVSETASLTSVEAAAIAVVSVTGVGVTDELAFLT